MKCVECGRELKEGIGFCEHCLSKREIDADFIDLDEKQSGNGFRWLLVIVILLVFFWLFSGEKLQSKNSFDITKGKSEYGDWYRDTLVYRTDMLNFSAFLSNKLNGQVELSFIVPSSQCTEIESKGFEHVINVNRIPVKYFRHCYSRGFEQYVPTSFQENEVVINEFIKSDNVLVENLWFAPDAVFSAIGFTKTLAFMSGQAE